MKRVQIVLLSLIALLFFSPVRLFGQLPRTISYQGIIATSTGALVPDGLHSLAISLYEAPTGGTPIFTEVVGVTTFRGVFNVNLGATTGGIPASVPFDRAYFIGVSVDGGSELQPRGVLTSVPYALRATVAEQAIGFAPGVTAGGDLLGAYPDPTIKAGAVTSDKIADGAISGAKIADQGVGFGKISRSGAVAGEVLGFDGTSVSWRPDGVSFPLSHVHKVRESAIHLIDSAAFSTSGSSPLLRLELRDTSSTRTALSITTASHGIPAISASTTGGGSAAIFSKNVDRATAGGGTFIGSVLVAEARTGSEVTAAEFNAFDTSNSRPAVDIQHRGRGVGLQVDATGANIATFRHRRVTGGSSSSTSTVVRFDSTGKGFFDGGTQTGGADVAEAFDVAGDRASYEPGDVLAISTERARQVTLSSEPYSTLVAGVYATKPGVLLTEAGNQDDISMQVPMGVIGVIPTKVTLENGPIRIGDLIVASSTPGHAMRGDPAVAKEHPGCILGKALESYDGKQPGVIEVLVNVR